VQQPLTQQKNQRTGLSLQAPSWTNIDS
jgi:hypothetical protein